MGCWLSFPPSQVLLFYLIWIHMIWFRIIYLRHRSRSSFRWSTGNSLRALRHLRCRSRAWDSSRPGCPWEIPSSKAWMSLRKWWDKNYGVPDFQSTSQTQILCATGCFDDYPSNHSIRFDSTATQFQGSLFWEGEFLLLWSCTSDQTSREGLCEDLSCRKSCLLWIKDLYFFVHRNYYWLVKLRNLDSKNGRWFCGSRQKAMLVHTVVVSVKCFFLFFPERCWIQTSVCQRMLVCHAIRSPFGASAGDYL